MKYKVDEQILKCAFSAIIDSYVFVNIKFYNANPLCKAAN